MQVFDRPLLFVKKIPLFVFVCNVFIFASPAPKNVAMFMFRIVLDYHQMDVLFRFLSTQKYSETCRNKRIWLYYYNVEMLSHCKIVSGTRHNQLNQLTMVLVLWCLQCLHYWMVWVAAESVYKPSLGLQRIVTLEMRSLINIKLTVNYMYKNVWMFEKPPLNVYMSASFKA